MGRVCGVRLNYRVEVGHFNFSLGAIKKGEHLFYFMFAYEIGCTASFILGVIVVLLRTLTLYKLVRCRVVHTNPATCITVHFSKDVVLVVA
jgi:hypothetical protein